MQNAEMNVVRFYNDDVIATSESNPSSTLTPTVIGQLSSYSFKAGIENNGYTDVFGAHTDMGFLVYDSLNDPVYDENGNELGWIMDYFDALNGKWIHVEPDGPYGFCATVVCDNESHHYSN